MKIKKVLLMNSPFPMEKRYGKGMSQIGTLLPPLGLAYLGAVLEENGYEVVILDCQLRNYNIAEAIGACKKICPDVIGITSFTGNFNLCISLGNKIRKEIDVPIIFGGPHPSLMPQEAIKRGGADYVIIGEGEKTLIALLDSINKNKEPKNVKGIAYKKGKEIKITQASEPIMDLDSLPFPARHLLDLKKYKPSPNQYKNLPMFTMVTSRGCPYNCAFCSSKRIWGRLYRQRSVKNVVDEIQMLIERYGAREIGFWDDLWGLSKKWITDFCLELDKRKIKITWSCEMRVNNVDEEILKMMKSAGCWCIFYGIESLNQEILDAINKQTNIKQILEALRLTSKVGIETRANYMLALPKETPEKVKKMVKRMTKINSEYVKFNIFTPYPGTRVYEEIKQGKWGRLQDDLDNYTGYFPVFVPYGYKNIEEVKKMKNYAFKKYYLRPAFIIHMLSKVKSVDDLKRMIRGFFAIVSL